MASIVSSQSQARPRRPRPPHRTLSSSLRQYSSPLLPRSSRDFLAVQNQQALSPSLEATEVDPLLDSLSQNNASPRVSLGYADDDINPNHVDDDPDVEADQFDEQADSDGLYPPNSCWTLDGTKPSKRSDPFGIRDCDVFGNIHR